MDGGVRLVLERRLKGLLVVFSIIGWCSPAEGGNEIGVMLFGVVVQFRDMVLGGHEPFVGFGRVVVVRHDKVG